jgi:hypothetical protein
LNRVKIFIADPTIKDSRDEIERLVNDMLRTYPKAGITWLQSAVADSVALTAIVKWDDFPPTEGEPAKGQVLSRRTGSGKAWR